MTDNAVLADMAVNDSHFLPHRALLNDLGRRRLGRLVSLMEAYAGTIRFNTASSDEELIEQRLATIMDFLSEAGIETEQEVVRCDMPGGKGMSAVEAILIKVNEGTYDPEQRGSQSGAERSFTGN
jgi:thiamine monophosphate kinase